MAVTGKLPATRKTNSLQYAARQSAFSKPWQRILRTDANLQFISPTFCAFKRSNSMNKRFSPS